MPSQNAIDRLPESVRSKVVDALLAAHAAGEEPDYRRLAARLKLPCTFSSLYRFDRKVVQPSLKRRLQSATSSQDVEAKDVARATGDTREAVVADTKQALADDPILRLWDAQRFRLEKAVGKTLETEQFDVYSRLETALAKNIEGTARTVQHPGWSSSAVHTTNNVVVVMPSMQQAPEAPSLRLEAADVIDVSFDADKR